VHPDSRNFGDFVGLDNREMPVSTGWLFM
jgi:hypothetical protein